MGELELEAENFRTEREDARRHTLQAGEDAARASMDSEVEAVRRLGDLEDRVNMHRGLAEEAARECASMRARCDCLWNVRAHREDVVAGGISACVFR